MLCTENLIYLPKRNILLFQPNLDSLHQNHYTGQIFIKSHDCALWWRKDKNDNHIILILLTSCLWVYLIRYKYVSRIIKTTLFFFFYKICQVISSMIKTQLSYSLRKYVSLVLHSDSGPPLEFWRHRCLDSISLQKC